MKQVVDVRHTVTPPPARTMPARAEIPTGQRLGSLIGGIFGLIYVAANAGSLPEPWPAVLRIAAVVAFAGLAVLLALARFPHSPAGSSIQGGFGGSYWLVVAGEAAAIVAGAAILSGPAGLPRAVVAWVSIVVGVHFLVLAALWRLRFFRHLGAAIALCGAVGLTAAASGAPSGVIAAVGGVLPGLLLLTAAYGGASAVIEGKRA